MTTTPPLLTDEQIDELRFKISTKAVTQRDHEVARFVESATRAPLLAEIERLTAELAKARAALEVAIHGYKCISSSGAVLFTESKDAAAEMQRQGWTVIELSEAKPVAVPDGYALVPVKPTWDMQIAASTAYREARDGHYTARMEQARDCWAAMLAAAPKD